MFLGKLKSGREDAKKFGLGRYFYDFDAPWVDIDEKSRPKKSPALAPWMVPENWRKGQRPSGRVAASSQVTLTAGGSNSTVTSNHRNGNGNRTPSSATSNKSRQHGSTNGSPKNGVKPEGTATQSQHGSELDERISALQETVGCLLTSFPDLKMHPLYTVKGQLAWPHWHATSTSSLPASRRASLQYSFRKRADSRVVGNWEVNFSFAGRPTGISAERQWLRLTA